MDFSAVVDFNKRDQAQLLVIPFWKEKRVPQMASKIEGLNDKIALPIETGDFTGKEGEFLLLYPNIKPEQRIALLGLGEQDKISVEKLRRAFAPVVKACRQKKIQIINIVVPNSPSLSEEAVARGVAEGVLLPNYVFQQVKEDVTKEGQPTLISKVNFIGMSKKGLARAKRAAVIAKGVYLARDLTNDNADTVTPQYLARVAQNLAQHYPALKTTVFNKARIQKEKMGLLLAVSRASLVEPAFILVEYKGDPKSKEHTVLIGKGITFDTGGLNLKGTGFMETMRRDMGGAAAVLGTLQAAASLNLKINLTGIIPSTENAIGPNSYKPGDVYTSYSGKTVEIGNTDAEGRLILADAISYAKKNLNPTRIIDIATLTGGMDLALGNEVTGFMSNDDILAQELTEAGQDTFERLWRFPVYEEYREYLKSDLADIKSTGGRSAGSILSSIFLKEFVGETPWAHLDIASTAYLPDARRYLPKYASGIGVRLLIDYLEKR